MKSYLKPLYNKINNFYFLSNAIRLDYDLPNSHFLPNYQCFKNSSFPLVDPMRFKWFIIQTMSYQKKSIILQ